MPEVEKKLGSNLNNSERSERSLPEQEFNENISSPEKLVKENIPLEKSIRSQTPSSVPVSEEEEKISNLPVNNHLREAIDDILEEGLADIYLNMSPSEQSRFKIKGEETTKNIVSLLSKTKVKIRKIVQAIIEWLKMISGVNRFFIKQTAKIKTDKILEAKEKELSE